MKRHYLGETTIKERVSGRYKMMIGFTFKCLKIVGGRKEGISASGKSEKQIEHKVAANS